MMIRSLLEWVAVTNVRYFMYVRATTKHANEDETDGQYENDIGRLDKGVWCGMLGCEPAHKGLVI